MAGRIQGITIRIDGDATPLTTALKSVDAALKKTSTNLRDLNKGLKLDPGNTQLLKDRQTELANAIKLTQDRLEKEKQAYRELEQADQTPETVERMRQLKTQIDLDTASLNSLQREAEETAAALNKIEQEATESASALGKLKAAGEKMQAVGDSIKAVGDKMQEVGKKIKEVGGKISGVGQTLTTHVTAPISAAFTASIKSAIDWESAFVGVMKTVDETATTTYDDLKKAINEIAKTTASSQNEVAAVMEIGGQLGVIADDLPEFAKTMIMLGDTTNLSAEEAASSIAKFSNITHTSIADSGKLGSVIVDLGNNFATTEQDIMNMAMRLAGAGAQVGLTDGEILGLSAALSSVGIEAEMGGSAFSKAMIKMQVAVETGFDQVNAVTARTKMSLRDLELMSQNDTKGFKELADSLGMTKGELTNLVKAGTNLEDFAKVSGTTVDEFVKLYRNDSVAALQAFIQGLGDTESAGETTIAMLQEMGFTEVRLRDTLTRLANSGDLVTNAIAKGNDAWAENTAMSAEAEKRYATMESKISQLKARFTEIAVSIGETLMPHLEKLMGYLEELADKWQALSPAQQEFILKAAAVAAAVGPILMVIGGVITAIGTIVSAIGAVVSAIGTAISMGGMIISSMGGIIAVLSGPVGIILAIVAAIGALIAAFVHFFNTNEEFRAKVLEVWEAVKAAFASGFEQISAWVASLGEILAPIGTAFMDTFSAIGEFIGTWVDIISTYISNFLTNNQATIDAALGFLKMLWQNTLDVIRIAVETVFNAISTFLTGTLSVIQNLFRAFTSILKGDWQSAWNYLVSAARSFIGVLLGVFNNLTSGIKQIFTSLVQNFKTWGGEMISNLVQGIKDKIGDVKEAISGIGDAIRERIHFSEPDIGPLSDFSTWAPDMMKLFAQGITDNASLITDAVNKSFNIKPVVNQTVIQGQNQTTPASSGPISVNVTLEGDANRLYRVVRAEAVRNQQITGMSFA